MMVILAVTVSLGCVAFNYTPGQPLLPFGNSPPRNGPKNAPDEGLAFIKSKNGPVGPKIANFDGFLLKNVVL